MIKADEKAQKKIVDANADKAKAQNKAAEKTSKAVAEAHKDAAK
jgi:hypothetical protein